MARKSRIADREERLQATLEALRDANGRVGHAWMAWRKTSTVGGALRMTVGLEPVWQPLTPASVIRALGRHQIRVREAPPRAGIDVRAIHVPSGVELDLALAPKLSARVKRHLDSPLGLGRGWEKRPPKRRR